MVHEVVFGVPFGRKLGVCVLGIFSRESEHFLGWKRFLLSDFTTLWPLSQKPKIGHLVDDAWRCFAKPFVGPLHFELENPAVTPRQIARKMDAQILLNVPLQRRYLAQSTGNLHGLQADEFHQTKWPLPRMFGDERYAYSLIDIEDPRYV